MKCRAVVLGIVVTLLFLRMAPSYAELWADVPEPRSGVPSVYVDRSHDWLFAYDDLADRMLRPMGFDVVLSDCSLSAVSNIVKYDVLVLLNIGVQSTFSEKEMALVLDYASGGGSVVVVTKPDAPVARLARRLDFRFTGTGQRPMIAGGSLTANGSPRHIATRWVNVSLTPPAGAETLVTDAVGSPVAAAVQYGKGRIVIWADDYGYWDFCAQRDPDMHVASAPTTVALFRWLADSADSPENGTVRRVEAEKIIQHGSLTLRYSEPIADDVDGLLRAMPDILQVVRKWNGRDLPSHPPFVIHFLATGGGGWAGPYGVGISVYGGAYPIKVMGHEMTHSITGPFPAVFGEGWASVVGMRAAEALGKVEDARSEHDQIMRRLDTIDPNRDALDIMQSEKGPYVQDYYHKAIWMILELERNYGKDFMARVLDLRDSKYGVRGKTNLTQLLELFAEVAQDKAIYDWYAEIGITGLGEPSAAASRASRDPYQLTRDLWGKTVRIATDGRNSLVVGADRGDAVLVPGKPGSSAGITFNIVRGLLDNRMLSLESADSPGVFLRHQGFRLKLSAKDDVMLETDATFLATPGLNDASGVSFRSFNFPERFIAVKERNELWLVENPSLQEATFFAVEPTQ